MTVPVSNMTATFANTDYRYDAIGMDANTFGQAANTTLIHLKANSNTRFSVDIYGNTYANGNVAVDGTVTVKKDIAVANIYVTGNTVTNRVVANIANISTANITTANITTANIATANVTTLNAATITTTSITLGGSAVGSGQQTIWVPAKAMNPNDTNGATANTWETATNDVMVSTLDFDPTTQQNAQFGIQMPKSWDEGTLIAQFVWSHPSTTTNYGVTWDIAAIAFGNSDALDTAFSGNVTVSDTGGTTNDVWISPETSAMTVAGTPGEEEYVVFKVRRAPANGSDTMAVNAQLHGVKIHYTTNTGSDD